MTEITPETVRAEATCTADCQDCSHLRDIASAWDADIARIEALEFDRNFWHGWAVKLAPQLDVLAVEQHITPEDVERVAALAAEEERP